MYKIIFWVIKLVIWTNFWFESGICDLVYWWHLPISREEVLKAVSKLKRNKGLGLDLLPPELLIDSAGLLCDPICKLFNFIFSSSSYPLFFYCWGLTTRQPLWVILCRLPEKGRREIEEIVEEETKERDRVERGKWMKVKTQKKFTTHTCCKDTRPCPTVSQYQLDALVTQDTRHLCHTQPPPVILWVGLKE